MKTPILNDEHKEQLNELIEGSILPALEEDLYIEVDEDHEEDAVAQLREEALKYIIQALQDQLSE
jgi:hypothetical protein